MARTQARTYSMLLREHERSALLSCSFASFEVVEHGHIPSAGAPALKDWSTDLKATAVVRAVRAWGMHLVSKRYAFHQTVYWCEGFLSPCKLLSTQTALTHHHVGCIRGRSMFQPMTSCRACRHLLELEPVFPAVTSATHILAIQH